jgi:hypothetical protein
MTAFRLLTIAALVHAVAGCALIYRAPAVDVNNDPPNAIASLPGLDETAADRIVAGRPYWKKWQLVERHLLTASQYARVRDELYVGSPAIPEYLNPVPPVTW